MSDSPEPIGRGGGAPRHQPEDRCDETLRQIAAILSGRPAAVEDWRTVFERARDERVAPLLYYHLQNPSAREPLPPEIAGDLRSHYYNASGLNLSLYDELARVLEALGDQEVVLLKGAALATTLYPNVALRPMSDLDLLLKRDRIAPSVRALEALGYREVSPEASPGLSRDVHYHVALHGGPRGSVAVELHWGLVAGDADWRAPEISWFWRETEAWTFDIGTRRLAARQLTPTAHLLYLAAHLMLQHGEAHAHLLWFYDVHLLVARWKDRVDWRQLGSRARGLHWSAALSETLRAAQDLFETDIPGGFLSSLTEHEDRRARRLVHSKADPLTARGAGVWNELRCLGWRGRFRLARSILWPSPHYMRWRYRPRPSWLWPLCYPYRWGIVLAEAAAALRKR